MTLCINLDDYEALARERLEPATWGYYVGGSDDEVTLRGNREAFARVALRPRVLCDVSRVSLATRVLGAEVAAPILVAPMAYQKLAHPDGEVATARAAARAGVPFCASTMATTSLEDTAAAAPGGPRWFQVYVFRERAVTEALVRRAEAAGYQALVLTGDTPRLGRRERDVRSGFGLPPHLGLANFAGALGHEPSRAPGESGIAHYAGAHLDDSLDWGAVAWLRSLSRLPVLVKGILCAEDVALARDAGVDGIIVSNHGGRQLDGALAAFDALPEVVAAAAGLPVFFDGGIRRGTDVLKALAIGAQAVLVGRAVLWGLAAAGEEGVSHVLALLCAELELAMALAGRRRIADLDASLVRLPR